MQIVRSEEESVLAALEDEDCVIVLDLQPDWAVSPSHCTDESVITMPNDTFDPLFRSPCVEGAWQHLNLEGTRVVELYAGYSGEHHLQEPDIVC